MPDPLRVGLFLLSLVSVVGSSLIVAGGLRLGGVGSLLAIWALGTGQVIVLAEGLSLLGVLDWPGFLAGHLVIAAAAGAWARGRAPAARWRAACEIWTGLRSVAAAAGDWRVPAVPIVAGATVLAGLINAAIALGSPPTSWDSMTYHLTRVGYYLQFGSLAPYPTDDWRQIVFPANAELLKLWTVAFLRADWLANSVQLLTWGFTTAAVYGVGRQVALPPRAALFAACAFALLPQSILQSTSTLNDLVVAGFLPVCLFFLLLGARSERPTAALALAGLAFGLALGTKVIALLAGPGLAAAAALLYGRRILDRRVLLGLLLGGLAVGLLGGYFYVQNWVLFGSPTGPGALGVAGGAAGQAIGPGTLLALAIFGLALGAALLVAGRFRRRAPAQRALPTGRLGRSALAGLVFGGVAAGLLGASFAVQGWSRVEGPTVVTAQAPAVDSAPIVTETPPEPMAEVPPDSAETPSEVPTDVLAVSPSWQLSLTSLVANLLRALWGYALVDPTGPLAATEAGPLREAVRPVVTAAGQALFGALGVPTYVDGVDIPSWPRFSFFRSPRPTETSSGIGTVGGLMLVAAAVALVWPRRIPATRRLLGLTAWSFLVLLSLVSHWNPWAIGRFLIPAGALAAPLLGLLVPITGDSTRPGRPRAWRQGATLGVAIISAVIGLYVACFGNRPLWIVAEDRGRLGGLLQQPHYQAFFREVEEELGPTAAVGVHGFGYRQPGLKDQWEYPFFGARFTRTVVPLAEPGWEERTGLRRPPWQTKDTLLADYRPSYIALETTRSGADVLQGIAPGACFDLPLDNDKPRGHWELWRCDDSDPRSVLHNGVFALAPDGQASVGVDASQPVAAAADGWEARTAGAAALAVARPEATAGGEPFRLRLDYRAAGGPPAGGTPGGGIIQIVPVDDRLRGATLVVDARIRADRPDTALLRVADGATSSTAVNRSADTETLRVRHRVGEGATRLQIGLVAGRPEQDATILVRTILAIPR